MAPVGTIHIAAMYDEAARLARDLHGFTVAGRDQIDQRILDERTIDTTRERIDNLTSHARAELEDERLRARDGWPVV